jgi:starch synthase
MKILMATSEFSPLASTGDLGDQVGILAAELKRLGHDVSVVIPLYRSVRESTHDIRPTGIEFQLNLGGKRASTDIVETTGPNGIQVFMIRRDEYFDRSGIYGGNGRAYEDNAERFIFFSKVVCELAQRLTPSPEIIHCHDWTAALVPVFVRDRQSPFRTVLTIHNLEHQGSFWSFDFALTNLPGSYFSPSGVEFYGRLNFLKGGILYADAITLPGEIALFEAFTVQHSFGLDAVLREHHYRTFGIPHGVEYSETNPPFETLIEKGPKDGGKAGCRQAVLEQLGLERDVKGLVYALPIQPQDDAAFAAVKPFADLILTSSGCLITTGKVADSDLGDVIVAERKYPTRFSYLPDADVRTRQLALAGADAVLFPSSLGLRAITALSAMRYATVPVVKSRGGVHQIVSDYDPETDAGNGFIYYDYSPKALFNSMRRASELYQQTNIWSQLMARAQKVDMSWTESATAFTRLYAELLRHQTVAA